MKSVAICGSIKFIQGMKAFADELEKAGIVVYVPDDYDWSKVHEKDVAMVALGLTHDHFYKIRMADIVFVYNKDGYSGVSTSMEIGYAVACDKPIYALFEDTEEIARNVLFRAITPSAEALVKYLK